MVYVNSESLVTLGSKPFGIVANCGKNCRACKAKSGLQAGGFCPGAHGTVRSVISAWVAERENKPPDIKSSLTNSTPGTLTGGKANSGGAKERSHAVAARMAARFSGVNDKGPRPQIDPSRGVNPAATANGKAFRPASPAKFRSEKASLLTCEILKFLLSSV